MRVQSLNVNDEEFPYDAAKRRGFKLGLAIGNKLIEFDPSDKDHRRLVEILTEHAGSTWGLSKRLGKSGYARFGRLVKKVGGPKVSPADCMLWSAIGDLADYGAGFGEYVSEDVRKAGAIARAENSLVDYPMRGRDPEAEYHIRKIQKDRTDW